MDGIGALLADHTPSISDMLADTGLPEAVRNGLLMATGTAIGATLGGASGAASGFNEITNNGLFTAVIKRVGVPALIACLKDASCRALTGVTGVAIAAQAQQILQVNPGMSEGNAFTVAITDLGNYGLAGKPATPLPGGGPTVTPGAAVQGDSTTAGNQLANSGGGSDANGGYAAGTQPIFNPLTMAVPPSLLGSDGSLLPGINGTGTPIPMPPSINPDKTAEEFARNAFNRQQPLSVQNDLVGPGSWLAKLPDGTSVLYRPSGQATRTDADTASVDIDGVDIRALNKNRPAKFKFPDK